MYIVTGGVKRKVKDLGFRCNKSFINQLEVLIDIVIEKSADYCKPKKTITADEVAAWMVRHSIK
jgi:hypothetical protein